ncbi:hypothetical protein SDC9_04136 [bioreactor metagenome]|uniref:Phage tail tape measure protein domain-containing protein n=1 Tax=bioreactor metagenome TaxID=1076179 RepID=A0A644SY13_9ZZZZ|nr:phage tail tape measure protein [Negativicutes bacterium]
MAGKMYEIAFNILGKVNSSFGSAFTGAANHMSQLNTKVSGLKAQMKELEKQQKSGAISVYQYAASYEKLASQLDKAEAAQKKYSRVVALQSKAEKIQSGAKNVAMGSAAIGGAIFSGPVMASVNFETAMAGVAKQVDGARNEAGELTAIGKQAQQDIFRLSKTLMKSPSDIANAYALGARAGVKGTENLAKITEMGIMMGTAFEMPAEQITTDMAKIGTALGYNLGTEKGIAQLEALADKINYVDDQTLATGPDLINFMNRTAGAIKNLAPTMSEGMTVGLGAGLLAAGERAEVAGTAINAMLTKFAAAPTQAKGFQNALATIGMSAEELQANVIKDADGAILDLFNRINQLDQASRNNVMAELIGAEHIDTVSKLTGNYDKFLGAIKLANDEAAKGSVRKEFEVMSKTTAKQLEGVQAALMRTFIIIGNNLLPVIQSVSGRLSGFLEGVQAFTAKYPKLTNVLALGSAAALALGVVLGGLVWVLGGVASSALSLVNFLTKVQVATKLTAAAQWLWNAALWGARMGKLILDIGLYAGKLLLVNAATRIAAGSQWLWNAAMMANPIGLVIAGIALLAGGVYLLYQHFDTVRDAIDSAWAAFQSTFPNAAAILQNIGDKVGWLAGKIKSMFGGGESIAVNAPNVATNASGGIYSKGAFLTTFAENSAEAAIPLDGSPRALSLWQQAGEMLGVRQGGGISIGQVTFAPVLQGGNTRENEQMLRRAQKDFMGELAAVIHQEKRVSFA